MRDNGTIKQDLRNYILSEVLPGESPANLKDNTPLRTSGVLDSMGLLGLVSFVEEQYSIELEAHETGIDNFDTIDSIASLIETKIAGRDKA